MKHDLPQIADRLRRSEPALVSSLDFGPFVAQGCGSGASLLIGDGSEISLLGAVGARGLDYRMALLARPGDCVLVRKRDTDFEAYMDHYLGVKDVAFIEVGAGRMDPVARLARGDTALVQRLAQLARCPGGLTLKAYLTTGHIWRLAQVIGRAAEQVVHVCGPSPRVARRANDKLWFSRVAHDVLGPRATPPTLSAFGPAAAAGLVSYVAKQAERVIVKVPDSAGSAGNISLESVRLRGRSLIDIRGFLLACLHATGWQDTYPILVGVWDADVTSSPSAQLWIPDAADGPPVCEGVFAQSVVGTRGTFVGAARSSIPAALEARMVDQALQMAQVLQAVGYFGRCSFDAVIQHDARGNDVIHWIECNGRWGGVSIPLTAMKQHMDVTPDGFVVVQETLSGVRLTTPEVIATLDDLLWRQGDRAGLILTAPGKAATGIVLAACCVDQSEPAAGARIGEAFARFGCARD